MPDERKTPESERAEQIEDLPARATGDEADAVTGGGAIVEDRPSPISKSAVVDASIRMGAEPHL